MSKKKKTKKKSPAVKQGKKKHTLRNALVAAGVVAAAAAVCVIIWLIYINTSLEAADFTSVKWRSTSAFDASGDEADLQLIYNNHYGNYKGSLTLGGDGRFSFWMSVGDPEDGTHKGSYTYDRDKNVLNAVFDNGDKAEFRISRADNGTINYIEAPYNGYKIRFTAEENDELLYTNT